MTPIRHVGLHSAVYTAATLLQKGLGVILLPLYTRCLVPDDYGALAVVSAVGVILAVLCSMGLDTALVRLYPEVKDDEVARKRLLGTVISVLALVSVSSAALLALVGPWVLGPFLGDVPFYPLVAIGLVTVALAPAYDTFLCYLQATHRSVRYSIVSLTSFVLKVGLAVALVVGAELGAAGALLAQALALAATSVVVVVALRHDIAWTIDRALLARAFAFGRVMAPQSIAMGVKGVLDRVFLNHFVGLTAAGVYSIGFQLAALVQVAVACVNRALFPVFIEAIRSSEPARIEEMRSVAGLLVSVHCTLALVVSLFAREAVALLAGPGYAEAAIVVLPLAFSFAALGIQSIFSRELLYSTTTARWISVTGVSSVLVGAAVNVLVIPRYGIVGAALVALLSQVAQTTVLGLISCRVNLVRWDVGRFVAIYVGTLVLALAVTVWAPEPSLGLAVIKACIAVATAQVLLAVSGGRSLFGSPLLKRLSWIR